MENIILEKISIKKVDLSNELIFEEPLELDIKMDHKIDIDKSKEKCISKINVQLAPNKKNKEGESSLRLTINIEGFFSTDGKFDNKPEISVRTYEKLFPHLQAYVTALTAMAGIPPILIPEAPLGMVHDDRKK